MKIVAPGILFYELFTFVLSVLNFVFLTTSLSTTSLIFFQVYRNSFEFTNSTFVFKLFKLVGTLTNLAISNLSASIFKAIKSFLAAKSDVLTPVV